MKARDLNPPFPDPIHFFAIHRNQFDHFRRELQLLAIMVAVSANVRVWALLFFSLCVARRTAAIWLNLPATGTKCVSDEIHNNVVVLADFVVISDDHIHPTPTISAKVTSPYGNTLYRKENITHGQFAFTTTEAGSYLACFWVDGHYSGTGGLSINMEWKTGIAAKDWESVARKEKIEGVELELRKLEEAVEAVHENLLFLKSREAEMRTMNEATNYRVALYSLMSLTTCIIASILQILYLTRYFQKKKLI